MVRNKYLWAACVWTIAITVLCLMSSSSFEDIKTFNIPGKDKYLHGVFYFIFTGLWYVVFHRVIKWTRRKSRYKAFVLAVSYGCLIELMQLWLTNDRSADGLDALANTAGAALAVLVLWRVGKTKEKI